MNESLVHIGPEGKGTDSPHGPTIELNNILAPIDFSPASRQGLAFAGDMAKQFQSRVHLLYVVEPPSLPQWGYAHLPTRDAKLRRAAEERMPQFRVESGIDPTLVGSATVRSGGAEMEICEAAVERNADLIVVASHGLGGVKHALIGSTAERVVRHAPCPVLTVRDRVLPKDGTERPYFAPKRILVTTDFSEASKKAFPYAAALARKYEALLVLAYVVPGQFPAEASYAGIMVEEDRMLSKAREELPRFRAVELDPHLRVETMVLNGNAAFEICAAAENENADLVVISTHGHAGLKRFLLGSVTEDVVTNAPCPVLVVREREHEFLKA